MTTKTFFSKIGSLLQSTEMFEHPRKKIPGKWQLCEYFVDEGKELVHLQEEELKARKASFEIEFQEGSFTHFSNIPLTVIQRIKNGKWSVAKNFITLIDDENFRNNTEFQFAFEKGKLKLLKKDPFGKIEFFGFFTKQDSKH